MRSAFLILLATASFLTAQVPGTIGTNGEPGGLPGNTDIGPSHGVDYQGIGKSSSFNGRVVTSDGSPLPGALAIRQNCMGRIRIVAYTDSKGRFTFTTTAPGSETAPGDVADATGPTLGRARDIADPVKTRTDTPTTMAGCELTIELSGYRADPISLDRFSWAGHVADLGTMVVHPLANATGGSASATLLNAPADAKKAYERGVQSLQKNKPADAQKDLTKAVTIYPKFANAWLELGHANARQNQPEAAHDAFAKALEADPKLVEAQVELGVMAAQNKKWREAAQYLDAALKLDPVDFPQIWFTDAVANFNSGNYDGAATMAREALKIDTAHKNPQIDQLLGMALAQKHDFAGAAEELKIYLKLAPTAADFATVKAQLAQIEAIQAQSAR
jgi:tetratricopeptide (TPR) repeat protein